MQILFEDQHLLVINKPSGMASQGGNPRLPDVVSWVQTYLGRPYVGLIHRLDTSTSGVLLLAKRSKSATRLSADLKEHKITKQYFAWVTGTTTHIPDSFHFTDYIKKDEKSNVAFLSPQGKFASCTGEVLKRATHTLLKITLETGRTHQIRVQLSHRKCPVLGDTKYGGKPWQRLALHAHTLIFTHPMSKDLMKIIAPLPPELEGI